MPSLESYKSSPNKNEYKGNPPQFLKDGFHETEVFKGDGKFEDEKNEAKASAEIAEITNQMKDQAEVIIAEIEKAADGMTEPEKGEAEKLKQHTSEIVADQLKKISEQLGSNQGGWYEDNSTGEKYYVKFYKKVDQARVEFIANSIYEKLGIKAAKSSIFKMDGQTAIASQEISGAQSATLEEQRSSDEVKKGFLADAYLANWDVVGLCCDNIIKSDQGMVRVDNGGSLIFRAQGGEPNCMLRVYCLGASRLGRQIV